MQKVRYSIFCGCVSQATKNKLLEVVGDRIPEGWKIIAHHMTISFGKGVKNKEDLGKSVNCNRFRFK
jgi:hypothetical protein